MGVLWTPDKDRWDGHYEFGGPIGALAFIVFSHWIIYYFWACIEHNQGELASPLIVLTYIQHAKPTIFAFSTFTSFLLLQYVLAIVLPGPQTFGLPVPSQGGRRLKYRCNAVAAWYCLVGGVCLLHYTEICPLWRIREEFPAFMTIAVIYGDIVALLVYVAAFVQKRTVRMSGNHIYDFFMGSYLNPRLPGNVDFKIFAEIRNSWVTLFVLTISCASKMHQEQGYVSANMVFMILAHFLYVNACQKGEECIPTTWDIFYEKFGWMLIFWNFAGVPFLYCFQSLYISTVTPTESYSIPVTVCMYSILLAAYYIWDTANAQKNRFRMKRQGAPESIIRRRTFPQLPWSYLENPKTIKCDQGHELLIDGWYGYGRKIHYTADLTMAFLWGFSCSRMAVIPYFYFVFFFSHLTHRIQRDEAKCSAKYGKLWEKYIKIVPYRYIPLVY